MPPELATEAVEWLELRAMQDGSRPVDGALVEAWWTRDATAASALEASGRLVDASRRYAAMVRDYAGLHETSGAAAGAARLSDSAETARELDAQRRATREFKGWMAGAMDTILRAFLLDTDEPSEPLDVVADDLDIATLTRAAAGPNPDEALEAKRRLNAVAVQLGFYLPYAAIERGDYARAAYYLDLALLFDDVSPTTWYLEAQTHARLHDPDRALTALRNAATAGYRDLASLEADEAFARLRRTPEYQAVVETLRTIGDPQDVPSIDRPPVRRR
jgi:hypothetical protein